MYELKFFYRVFGVVIKNVVGLQILTVWVRNSERLEHYFHYHDEVAFVTDPYDAVLEFLAKWRELFGR